MKALPFKDGARILFQGDSITDCGCRDPQNINPLGGGYVSIVRGLISAQYPDAKLTILNRGRSGDRTEELLKRWDEDTRPLKPDWLSIMIGVNDVWRKRGEWQGQTYIALPQYRANYVKLLEQAQGWGISKLVLVSPTTIDDDPNSELNKLLEEYDATVRELAKKFNAIYVPARERMWKAIVNVPTVRWTSDGCHPTVAGHALLASVWLESVCS